MPASMLPDAGAAQQAPAQLIVQSLLQRFLPLARRRIDTAQAQVSRLSMRSVTRVDDGAVACRSPGVLRTSKYASVNQGWGKVSDSIRCIKLGSVQALSGPIEGSLVH